MSSFHGCARLALGASGKRPSHAWIALHRCVEGLARQTGEPFTSIFDRIGRAHGFGREPERWPNAAQIRAAAADLVAEKKAWQARYQALVSQRKADKRAGIRHRRHGELEGLEASRQGHDVPTVGFWGWSRRRGS